MHIQLSTIVLAKTVINLVKLIMVNRRQKMTTCHEDQLDPSSRFRWHAIVEQVIAGIGVDHKPQGEIIPIAGKTAENRVLQQAVPNRRQKCGGCRRSQISLKGGVLTIGNLS